MISSVGGSVGLSRFCRRRPFREPECRVFSTAAVCAVLFAIIEFGSEESSTGRTASTALSVWSGPPGLPPSLVVSPEGGSGGGRPLARIEWDTYPGREPKAAVSGPKARSTTPPRRSPRHRNCWIPSGGCRRRAGHQGPADRHPSRGRLSLSQRFSGHTRVLKIVQIV